VFDAVSDSVPSTDLNCPLCAGPNACAPAQSGSFETPCWCKGVTLSAALLARVPEGRAGLSCICPACVAGAAGEPAAPHERPIRLD